MMAAQGGARRGFWRCTREWLRVGSSLTIVSHPLSAKLCSALCLHRRGSMVRVLFLTQFLPYPLDAGAKMRAYYVLRYLARSHRVTLVSFVRADDPPDAIAHLQQFCEAVHTVPMVRSLGLNLRAGVKAIAHRPAADHRPRRGRRNARSVAASRDGAVATVSCTPTRPRWRSTGCMPAMRRPKIGARVPSSTCTTLYTASMHRWRRMTRDRSGVCSTGARGVR